MEIHGLAILLLVAGCMSNLCMGAEMNCPKTLGNTTFDKCISLPVLNSTLLWTYDPTKGSMDLAFQAKQKLKDGWVAWGLNLNKKGGMVGTQALIGFQNPNGTLFATTYNVSRIAESYSPSNISYRANNLRCTFQNGSITLFATVVLPGNLTKYIHTWQVGGVVNDTTVLPHPMLNANKLSYGELNLLSTASALSPPSPNPPSSSTTSSSRKADAYQGALLSFLFLSLLSLYGGVFLVPCVT